MSDLRGKRKVDPEEELIIDNPSPRSKQKILSNANWSNLSRDVLIRILENPTLSVEDFVMFSSVCRDWNGAAAASNLVRLRKSWSIKYPWLMETDGNYEVVKIIRREDLGDDSSYGIDDIEEVESVPQKLYPRKLWNFRNKYYKLDCPEGYGKVSWGSAYGWIVTTGLDHRMYMFNPLTKSRLSLPSRSTIPGLWYNEPDVVRNYFIRKAIVLKVPKFRHGGGVDDVGGDSAETLMVVALYDNLGRAVIAKPGDTCWTEVEWEPGNLSGTVDLKDVVCHNELGLLFVTHYGGLVQFDIWDEKQPPLLKWYCQEMSYIEDLNENVGFGSVMTYIAGNGHDIFMVLRMRRVFDDEEEEKEAMDSYRTFDFEIYKA